MESCIKSDHKYYTVNALVGISFGAIGLCVPKNYTTDYLNYELYTVLIPAIEKQTNQTIPKGAIVVLDPTI